MDTPKAPDNKQKVEQKKEGQSQDGMTAQKVMAELAGLGLIAHLVEGGEIDPNGRVDVSTDALAIKPQDQINPNRAFKPKG